MIYVKQIDSKESMLKIMLRDFILLVFACFILSHF